MATLAIVTSLALLQAVYFAFMVGVARGRHGVSAPQMTGHAEFERAFRVQQNTIEQLIVFLPAMWMFGYFIDDLWAAALGLVFVASQFVYRSAYMKDPAARSKPFAIGLTATAVLLLGALGGAAWTLLMT